MANIMEPIKPGLIYITGEKPGLTVGKCTECGDVVFPKQDFCPTCCTETMQEMSLNGEGELYAFTTVRNRPPECKINVPYGVGIVQFPEGVRIMGLLTEPDVTKLSVGQKAKIVIEEAYQEDDKSIMTYRFKPL